MSLPSSPPGPADVEAAALRTAGRLRTTPVVDMTVGGLAARAKLELLQHTGSFKARGILNQVMLAAEGREHAGLGPAEVVIASGGNAGAAAAWACRELELSCTVFVPTTSPPIKAQRIASYGAQVRLVEGKYDDAAVVAARFCAEAGALWVHPYDQHGVVGGQGMIFRELEAQADGDFDTVLVAVGGGGLIGGALAWLGERKKVVAVEPVGSACLWAARHAGAPVDVAVDSLAADSLGARRVGSIPWSLAGALGGSVLVEDAAISEAQAWLWAEWRLVVEPGGAACVAALASGAYVPVPDERVALLVCGANADVTKIDGLIPSAR